MSEPSVTGDYLYYCPKCGNLSFLFSGTKKICRVCKHKYIETPHEYDLTREKWNEVTKDIWNQKEQLFLDEVISKSPEFDMNLHNNIDNIKK